MRQELPGCSSSKATGVPTDNLLNLAMTPIGCDGVLLP